MRETVSRKEFEQLVAEALDQLPEQFAALLDNIAIVVDDEPARDDLREAEIPEGDELLGIFRGIARTEQSLEALPALPHQIAIFRGPILRVCRNRAEVVDEVRETVIHELGHYFGLGDDEMPF